MSRSVFVYATLLVVALVGAYLSWTHEAEPRLKDGVVVLDASEADLREVRYTAKDFSVSLTRKSDAFGEYAWVETVREEPDVKPMVNPHAPAPEAPADPNAKTHTVKRSFKAGSGADPVFGGLAPFVALRAVQATPEALEEFGLKTPKGKLELTIRDKTHVFEVGEEGYGHRNTYIRDAATAKIYLVDGDAIRPLLRGDERLPERRLFEADLWDIDRVEVMSGGRSVAFDQKNKADQVNASWVNAGSDAPNLTAKTWIEKFARMRAIGNPESMGDAEEVLTVKVTAGKVVTDVVLMRTQKDDGTQDWYARSPFTRGVVELPMALAANLADDFVTLTQ